MGLLENKKIIKYCPKYYKIVNFEFDEKDVVAKKLIQIFQEYTFMVNLEDKREIKMLVSFSESICKYFEDAEFKKELVSVMSNMKVKKGIDNILPFIVEEIVKSYNKYLEYYTRNLYIPRWI